MNDREQFEAWHESYIPQFNGELRYCDVDMGLFDAWKACAESKQAELDKANARIAQLEMVLNDLSSDGWLSPVSYRDTIAPSQQAAIDAIANSSDTWLSEHDKAVEVKVLEDATQKCRYYLKNQNYPIYEKTNDPYEHGAIIATENIEDILIKMIESRK